MLGDAGLGRFNYYFTLFLTPLFLFSDIFSGENTAFNVTLTDAFGLVAAVLIVTGAALGTRRRPTS